MNKELKDILFSPGEKVGYKSFVYRPRLLEYPSIFFVINPIKDLIEGATKENIQAYRNILIEFDEKSLAAQERYIKRMGLPVSAQVYSGNKSMHYHIALDKPIATDQEYTALTTALYAVLKGVDPQCKNCNRLARTPGILRTDTKKQQELIEVKQRISLEEDLIPWLKAKKQRWNKAQKAMLQVMGYLKPKTKVDRLIVEGEQRITFSTKKLMEEGEIINPNKSRHDALRDAGLDLHKCGYELGQIEEILEEIQLKIGLDRNDVPGIMKWLGTKIFY